MEFSLKEYNNLDHGYAATVYKAQGVTVDRSYVLASSYFDRHSTYVALSRHREGADIYYSREEFPRFANLSQHLSRERVKDVTLDYAKAYGQVRGVDESFLNHDRSTLPAERAESQENQQNKQNKQKEDRPIGDDPSSSTVSTTLTEDRLSQAEKRLLQRQYELAVKKDLDDLEQKMGLKFDMALEEGDAGIYRGLVEVAGRKYGILEQENQSLLDDCFDPAWHLRNVDAIYRRVGLL